MKTPTLCSNWMERRETLQQQHKAFYRLVKKPSNIAMVLKYFPVKDKTAAKRLQHGIGRSNLLCVGADPVDDSILIKVVLVSKGKGLSFPQLPHKDKGRALKVVPLLGHLGEQLEVRGEKYLQVFSPSCRLLLQDEASSNSPSEDFNHQHCTACY